MRKTSRKTALLRFKKFEQPLRGDESRRAGSPEFFGRPAQFASDWNMIQNNTTAFPCWGRFIQVSSSSSSSTSTSPLKHKNINSFKNRHR